MDVAKVVLLRLTIYLFIIMIVSRWNFILPLFPHKGNHTAKISPKTVHPFQYLLSVFPSAPFLYSVCCVMYTLASSSGIFMLATVHLLSARGAAVISIILGYNGGPPEKCYDEEGVHHILQELSFKSHQPPPPHPIKNERSFSWQFRPLFEFW